MTVTDNCDVYGALHEDGINRLVRHVMRQRPSMFNYATRWFVASHERLCVPIDAHPEVARYGNRPITEEPVLPVPGTGGAYGLDYCVQVTDMEVDFHPGNVIALPPELSPPLNAQRLALRAKVCAGIACPNPDTLGQLDIPDPSDLKNPSTMRPLPTKKINCFCLEVVAVCHVNMGGTAGAEEVSIELDGLEIVDIKPEGLENALECLIATTLRLAVLSKFKLALNFLTLTLEQVGIGLALKPTPTSNAVRFNPSVADNQLAVFMDLEVTP